MSKRYFYRDPLAAAWMAKHYGVRFEAIDEDGDSYPLELRCSSLDSLGEWFIEGDDFEHYGMFYIAPESLRVLEPQVGDIISRCHLPNNSVYFDLVKIFTQDDSKAIFEDNLEQGGRIIQRNGRPFHWPKEEVND